MKDRQQIIQCSIMTELSHIQIVTYTNTYPSLLPVARSVASLFISIHDIRTSCENKVSL